MVRAWETTKDDCYEDWGMIVLDIDYKKELVYIGTSIGYPSERKEWVHISDIKTTWNVGGFDAARKMINGFEAAVKEALAERRKS